MTAPPDTPVPRKPTQSRFQARREATSPGDRSRERRWGGLVAVAAAAVVAGVGVWTDHAVRESLDAQIRSVLLTVLDADQSALELWMEIESEDMELWSDQADVQEATEALITAARDLDDPHMVLLEHALQVQLRRAVRPFAEQQGVVSVAVVALDGTILSVYRTQYHEFIGRSLTPHGMEYVEAARRGEVVFERARRSEPLTSRGTGLPLSSFIGAAPIRRRTKAEGEAEAEILAALIVVRDVTHDFPRILGKDALGSEGESYALDDEGRFISPPTHDVAEIAGAFGLTRAADPGVDLTRGEPTGSPDDWPLTRMARDLVRRGAGVDLEGYRDFRGIPVVGAWRWVDELGLGLATEMTVAGAKRVQRPMRLAFWGLLAAVAVGGALVSLSSYRIRRLQRQITQLGQYTLDEKIGEGGMGVVYLASHALLARRTAIKLLRPEAVDDEALARFEREVQITSQLRHPNTIEIYDYGRTAEGAFYYAMEYLPGLTVADLVDLAGPLPVGRTLTILKQACGSLVEAHEAGLIHQDIKPLNIIVSWVQGVGDQAKVLDFGLVRDVVGEWRVTKTASISGTPAYMAPERIRDPENLDPRSDLYSLGVVAFNMLTGKDPFEGVSGMEVLYHAEHSDRPSPSAVRGETLPADLEALVLECMGKTPEERPPRARDMLQRLEALSHQHPWGQEEAAAWWEQNGPRIEELRGRAAALRETSGGEGATVGVLATRKAVKGR